MEDHKVPTIYTEQRDAKAIDFLALFDSDYHPQYKELTE